MTEQRKAPEKPEEPTEAAKLLHGDQAAVETNPQPDSIRLESGTLIAKPDDEGGAGK